MEKGRRSKSLFILVLSLLLLGTTIGFAAFSANLNISSSATVTPNEEDFKLLVSGSNIDPNVNIVNPEIVGDATADDITINNSKNSSSTSINVNFTEPGQSVAYLFYLHNVGQYDAFLNTLTFKNVVDSDSKKICNVVEEGDASLELVNKACEDIELSMDLKQGSQFINFKDSMSFDEIKLKKGYVTSGKVNIIYPEGSERADGAFNVQFGDIELTYSSAD